MTTIFGSKVSGVRISPLRPIKSTGYDDVDLPPPKKRPRMATGLIKSTIDATLARIAGTISNTLSRLALVLVAVAAIHDLTGTIRVVDGDTVDRWIWRWRLARLDAPEIRKAQCPEERAAGIAAAQRLREIIASGRTVRLAPAQWRLDKWGRLVGRLEVDGQDVAAILIAEGHARPYDGRSRRESWCTAP